jgi:anti-sigma B factor antagonist
MNNENTYKVEILDNYPDIAKIILKKQVLGGSDALEFNLAVQKVKENNVRAIIADLKDVEMINSTGLGMLVGTMSTLRNFNIAFVLINVPEKVNYLLEVTHLNKVLRIFKNLEDAISAFK